MGNDNLPVVICMKWGELYSSDYVNVLYHAVQANLNIPHKFVCLTDNEDGIVDGVECYPIPDPLVKDAFTRRGCWPKLVLFQSDLYGLKGRALFIDLDTIIYGDLKPLLEAEGEIILIREWRRFVDYFRNWKVNGQTSIFAFNLGELSYLYEVFAADPEGACKQFRNEQRFVTHYVRDMRFWSHPMVISFKRHLMAPPLINRLLKPREPLEGTSILVFHGIPRPIDVVPDNNQVWGSFFRYGRGSVKYVRDYWLKHGGKDPE